MKSNRIVGFKALFAAACLLLAAIFAPLAGARRSASAQEEKYSVGYVTDCFVCPSLTESELLDAGYDVAGYYAWRLDGDCDFEKYFKAIEELYGKSLDLVIFEFMRMQPADWLLESCFKEFSAAGIKIMLISGFATYFYENENFFQYVDVDYNVDDLHGNIYGYLEETAKKFFYNEGEDVTIVVDACLANSTGSRSEFIAALENEFAALGLGHYTILIYCGGQEFYNASSGKTEYYNSGYELAAYYSGYPICAMTAYPIASDFRYYLFSGSSITECFLPDHVNIYGVVQMTDFCLNPNGYPIDLYKYYLNEMGGGTDDPSEDGDPLYNVINKVLILKIIRALANDDIGGFPLLIGPHDTL